MKYIILIAMVSASFIIGCTDDEPVCMTDCGDGTGDLCEFKCPPGFVPPAQEEPSTSTGTK